MGIIPSTSWKGFHAAAQRQCRAQEDWFSDPVQDACSPAACSPAAFSPQRSLPLAVEELECQANDRRSFEEFVGIGVMNSSPDATPGAFFRERLSKAGLERTDAWWWMKNLALTFSAISSALPMLPPLLKIDEEKPNPFAGIDKIWYQLFETAASMGGLLIYMNIA